MRPYLAIILDSFHAALASRVLWAAFLAIWVLLASLAPIGTREDYTTSFQWYDVYNGTRMKALLAQGIVDPDSQDKAIGRIAHALPTEMQRQLRRVGEGDEVRIRLSRLTDALNELIDSEAATDQDAREKQGFQEQGSKKSDSTKRDADTKSDWYDEQAWSATVRLRELRTLDQTPDEELSDSLLRRRSRLRIEAALPGVFESRSDRSVLLTYAGLEFPSAFQVDRVQFEMLFNQFVIPLLVNWLLGLVLVFLGILVTASMIPDMLQTGSLHLLLSKPISRSALLISKFIGGCSFVLLCVSQLVIGLYLIAALRLGVENARILWCIPVAVIIFAVFFSVSVLAGLKWRSAIISIAAAGTLAALCMVVGIVGGVVDTRVVAPDRIVGMTTAGDELFAVTGGSGLVRLDDGARAWEPLIDSEAGSNDRVLKPVTLDEEHVLTARIRNGRFNPFGSGSLDLIVLSRPDDWTPQPSLRLPTATERLIPITDRGVFAVNTADLLCTDRTSILQAIGEETESSGEGSGEKVSESQSGTKASGAGSSVGSWLNALVTMQGGATESFVSILPPGVALSPPSRLTQVRGQYDLVLVTGDRIERMTPGENLTGDPWSISVKVDLQRETERASYVIAASSAFVLLARGDLPLRIFDAQTLEKVGSWEPQARPSLISGTPLELLAIAEDYFLLRTSSGHCDLIRVVQEERDAISDEQRPSESSRASVTLQSVTRLPIDEIESMLWQPGSTEMENAQLTIAHDIDRVSRFSFELPRSLVHDASTPAANAGVKVTRSSEVQPVRSVWRWVDYYVIGGLELLTPQVLQLGDTTAAMVSGNDSLVIGSGEADSAEVVRYQIAGPLLSCGIFISVMLAIGCFYFSRSDY